MRVRNDPKDKTVKYWYCQDHVCHVRLYIKGARLWAPGISAAGKTTAQRNLAAVAILKKQRLVALRDDETAKVVARVETTRDVKGMSASHLAALVMRHESRAVQEYAFNRLANRGDRPTERECLAQIASSDSVFAAKAISRLESP